MTSMFGALINGGGGPSITTPDLLKDVNKPITNTDYFDIVITDLKPDTQYKVQFAWVYENDSRSDYSATYTFNTDPETAPDVPSQPTVTAGPGLINVTWNGNKAAGGTLQGYAKVNIYVDGVLKDFFLAAGTKSIPLAKGTYAITLRSASSTNVISNATSPAVSITVTTDATDAATALTTAQNRLKASAAVIANANQEIVSISTSGVTVYSGASATTGARVVMNSQGIAGYNSSSTGPTSGETFAIDTATGSARFGGELTSPTGLIGGFSIGASALTHINGTATVGIYNASNILLGFSGGIKVIDTAGGDATYLVQNGLFTFPASEDGNLVYSGAFFNNGWRISDDTYGWSSINGNGLRLNASVTALSTTVGTASLTVNNGVGGIVIRRNSSTYLTQSANNNSLDNTALRNVYVSSTAGEPSPSSPSPGDIKLEW